MSVKELYESGVMRDLLYKGFISPSTYRSWDIFMEVRNLELSGMKRSHAVEEVHRKCRISERQVWNMIKKIES